ncbi:MAG: TolC family protein [Bacteroidetes bacterium]|nr:MAG: TolC family protein [Bacteroidota bacterium]
MKKSLWTALLFGFLSPLCLAQSFTLSLTDCADLAREESLSGRVALLQARASARDYDAYLASLRPQLTLNTNLPGFRRSITDVLQDDGTTIFVPQSQTFSNASLVIDQPLLFSGGRLSVFSSLSNFTRLDNAGFSTWQSTPFAVRLTQPLFAPNRLRWERREQDLRYDLSQIAYGQSREQAAAEAVALYFDLLIAQANAQRARTNVANNDTIYQLSKGRYSVGRIAENELLQSELSLMNARTALEQAQLQALQAEQALRTYLQLPADTRLQVAIPAEVPPLAASPETVVAAALRHSSFLRQTELAMLQAERELQETRAANRFNADLTATFGLNQAGATFQDAYQNLDDQETFSLGLSIPIWQWGQGRAEVEAALARQELTRTQRNQAEQTFRNDLYFRTASLAQVRAQLEVSARSDTVASRRYEITKQRYLIGNVSIQDLFIAQQEKDQAQITHISNLRNFWVALYRLRADALYDLVQGNPLVQE